MKNWTSHPPTKKQAISLIGGVERPIPGLLNTFQFLELQQDGLNLYILVVSPTAFF